MESKQTNPELPISEMFNGQTLELLQANSYDNYDDLKLAIADGSLKFNSKKKLSSKTLNDVVSLVLKTNDAVSANRSQYREDQLQSRITTLQTSLKAQVNINKGIKTEYELLKTSTSKEILKKDKEILDKQLKLEAVESDVNIKRTSRENFLIRTFFSNIITCMIISIFTDSMLGYAWLAFLGVQILHLLIYFIYNNTRTHGESIDN